MNLSPEERDAIYLSLSVRAGLIETGDPFLRAIDAQRQGKKDRIRALGTDQMKVLIMTEDLMHRMLNEKD